MHQRPSEGSSHTKSVCIGRWQADRDAEEEGDVPENKAGGWVTQLKKKKSKNRNKKKIVFVSSQVFIIIAPHNIALHRIASHRATAK